MCQLFGCDRLDRCPVKRDRSTWFVIVLSSISTRDNVPCLRFWCALVFGTFVVDYFLSRSGISGQASKSLHDLLFFIVHAKFFCCEVHISCDLCSDGMFRAFSLLQ